MYNVYPTPYLRQPPIGWNAAERDSHTMPTGYASARTASNNPIPANTGPAELWKWRADPSPRDFGDAVSSFSARMDPHDMTQRWLQELEPIPGVEMYGTQYRETGEIRIDDKIFSTIDPWWY
jgi:hypothetical protein